MRALGRSRRRGRARARVLGRRSRGSRRRDRARGGIRAGEPRRRNPELGRHRVRDRERREGSDGSRVASLVEEGALELSTTARSVLGDDLPLIDDAVTVEHLLSHRSGIGDYLDEDAGWIDHGLRDAGSRPRARLDRGYLAVLDGHPNGLRTGRALRVLQRRLRGAGVDRRADERRTVRRARTASRLRARRHGRHGLPALRRATRERRARISLDRGSENQRLPSARARAPETAASTRRSPTSPRSGLRSSMGRSSRATRVVGDGRASERGRRRSPCATALVSGCTSRSSTVILEGYDAGVSFRACTTPTLVDVHGHLEHVRRCVADGALPRRACGLTSGAVCSDRRLVGSRP